MSKKATIYASMAEKPITAAHGEMTGKPSFNTIAQKVTQKAEGDPRFDKRKDKTTSYDKPYCRDILVPDDGTQTYHAVINTGGEYKSVRHPFTWDGSEVSFEDGEPEETNAHTVYASVAAPIKESVIQAESTAVIHCRDNGLKITAEKSWAEGKTVEFQWMPPGISTICAGWGKRAIQLTVNCDKDGADKVQASLDDWKASHPNRTAFGCIEHKEQDASIRVDGFKWDDAKGILCCGKPTKLGASNVSGKVFDAWSPTFTACWAIFHLDFPLNDCC